MAPPAAKMGHCGPIVRRDTRLWVFARVQRLQEDAPGRFIWQEVGVDET